MVVMSVNGAAHPSANNDAGRNSPSGQPRQFRASHGGPFFRVAGATEAAAGKHASAEREPVSRSLHWPGRCHSCSAFRAASLLTTATTPISPDPGVWAKFFIGIGAFVLAEQQVERGLRARLAQFVRAPIIAPTAMAQATRELSEALRQR